MDLGSEVITEVEIQPQMEEVESKDPEEDTDDANPLGAMGEDSMSLVPDEEVMLQSGEEFAGCDDPTKGLGVRTDNVLLETPTGSSFSFHHQGLHNQPPLQQAPQRPSLHHRKFLQRLSHPPLNRRKRRGRRDPLTLGPSTTLTVAATGPKVWEPKQVQISTLEGEFSVIMSDSGEEDDDDYFDIPCEDEEDDECEDDTIDEGDDDDLSMITSGSRSSSVDILSTVSEVNSTPEILPAIRPSYFPYVPPYINFCLHDQRTENLPREISKHLKWRLSNITPVVVKKTLANSGFRLLRKTVEWSGQWGRHMKSVQFKTSLKDFQKLNHLPGTFQIGRKDRLWRNIQRFILKFGIKEFGFMPKTYILPLETKQLKANWDEHKGAMWIIKPPAGARGTGIRVVNRWHQIPKKKPMIVQTYIAKPYLINDRKFDLRLYVLVTSFHPLKVYLYNDGLVRFAPVKYSFDSKRAGDRFMHLTNYSINKNCELYAQNSDAEASTGHKWTLKTLWRYFEKEKKDVSKLWMEIEEIVIKTLLCAEDPITSAVSCNLPNLYNGYELFGFDIILDSDLKPWLLEVNISPSLHSSSPVDLAVKGPLIKEVFNIVGYHLPTKLSNTVKKMFANSLDVILDLETPVFDKRLYVNNCLTKEEVQKHKTFKTKMYSRKEYLGEILETLTGDDVRHLLLAEDELCQCENFGRIFPTGMTYTYFPFLELPRYYDLLFDAWEAKYGDEGRRASGVTRLVELCRQKVHLQVGSVQTGTGGSMTSESPVSEKQSTTGTSSAATGSPHQGSGDGYAGLVKNLEDLPQLCPSVLDNITNTTSISAQFTHQGSMVKLPAGPVFGTNKDKADIIHLLGRGDVKRLS